MNTRPLLPLISLLVAAPLLMTACSAPTQSDAAGGGGNGSTAEAEAAPLASPLDPYLDVLYQRTDSDAFAAEFVADEERVAQCMRDEGWEYTPRGAEYLDSEFGSGAPQFDSREWVAENGYGSAAEPADRLTQASSADPNYEYYEGLSDTDAAAYDRALHGDGEEEGCMNPDTSSAEAGAVFFERWQPLVQSLEQMWNDVIPAEQEWIDAEQEWSDCMAENGFPGLATPLDAQESVTVPLTEEGFQDVDADPVPRETQIEVALADFDCRVETSYTQRQRAVTVAAETEFLEQNREQLDAMLAESEQN